MSEFKLSYKESEKQILSANNIAEDIITNIEKSRYELNETHDSGENFAGTAMKASKKGFENTLIAFLEITDKLADWINKYKSSVSEVKSLESEMVNAFDKSYGKLKG